MKERVSHAAAEVGLGPGRRWPYVLVLVGAVVATLLSVTGLLWHWMLVLVLCPQALAVMFLRQAQGSFDSLGAAGGADLLVAVLYWPLVGWLLWRALRRGTFRQVAGRVMVWHAVASIAAVLSLEFRIMIWTC